MAISATQLRPGMVIRHNGTLHAVTKVDHRTPGNLRAFIQAKLRNLKSGAAFEYRFRSSDSIDRAIVDSTPVEFLYKDGATYYFMNVDTYDQVELNESLLADASEYLTPNLRVEVEYIDGEAVGIALPQTVEMKIVETEPGLRSATASSVTKPARTETGLVIQVPPFIEKGEIVRVDTTDGSYVSRAA